MDRLIQVTIPLPALADWLRAYGCDVRAPEDGGDWSQQVATIAFEDNGDLRLLPPGLSSN